MAAPEAAFSYIFASERVDDRVAQVEDSDRGIGIPEDLLDDVFLEFVRAPNATKHDRSGTGLGLSIVRGGLEMHGGTVAVTCAAGRGTTFTARLPLDYVPPELAEKAEADSVAD